MARDMKFFHWIRIWRNTRAKHHFESECMYLIKKYNPNIIQSDLVSYCSMGLKRYVSKQTLAFMDVNTEKSSSNLHLFKATLFFLIKVSLWCTWSKAWKENRRGGHQTHLHTETYGWRNKLPNHQARQVGQGEWLLCLLFISLAGEVLVTVATLRVSSCCAPASPWSQDTVALKPGTGSRCRRRERAPRAGPGSVT